MCQASCKWGGLVGEEWAMVLKRGQTVEGFERAAGVFGLNLEIKGKQLFSMSASSLPPSSMGDATNGSLHSPCRAMWDLRVFFNPKLWAVSAYCFQLRGNVAAVGDWEPLQVLEQKSVGMNLVFL